MTVAATMAAMAAMAVKVTMAKIVKWVYLMSRQFCSHVLNPCFTINDGERKAGHRVGEKETMESSHPFWMLC